MIIIHFPQCWEEMNEITFAPQVAQILYSSTISVPATIDTSTNMIPKNETIID